MLEMNRVEVLLWELIKTCRLIAERLHDARNRDDPGRRLLACDRPEGDVIVEEGGAGLADDLLISADVGNALAILRPQRVEEVQDEPFASIPHRNCAVRSVKARQFRF